MRAKCHPKSPEKSIHPHALFLLRKENPPDDRRLVKPLKIHVRASYELRTLCGQYLDIPGRENPRLARKWSEVDCGLCRYQAQRSPYDGGRLSYRDWLALQARRRRGCRHRERRRSHGAHSAGNEGLTDHSSRDLDGIVAPLPLSVPAPLDAGKDQKSLSSARRARGNRAPFARVPLLENGK